LQSASFQLTDDPFEVKLRDIYEVGSLFIPVSAFLCISAGLLVPYSAHTCIELYLSDINKMNSYYCCIAFCCRFI